jgi:chloramphenicol 3-O-phosphotransferase
MTPKPRIVILNGASSSGETTPCDCFSRSARSSGEFWSLTGIDYFLAKLPGEWMSVGPDDGPYAADGARFQKQTGAGSLCWET